MLYIFFFAIDTLVITTKIFLINYLRFRFYGIINKHNNITLRTLQNTNLITNPNYYYSLNKKIQYYFTNTYFVLLFNEFK